MSYSCQSKKAPSDPATQTEGINEVIAKEVIHASNYTYILVSEDRQEYWIAIPYTEIEVGKSFFFLGGMAMKDFYSKDLDRTFDLVYFVDEIFDEAPDMTQQELDPHGQAASSHLQTGRQAIEQVQGISIETAPGGVSIAQIFASPASFSGKSIILRGQVVKVNEGIMGKNWVHIQDGTVYEGKYDITVTTNVVPKVGNTITLEGVLSIDKDFGAGYTYDVIVEDARVVPSAL